MTDWEDIWRKKTAAMHENTQTLVGALKGLEIFRVSMHYEGSGDEGHYGTPVIWVLDDNDNEVRRRSVETPHVTWNPGEESLDSPVFDWGGLEVSIRGWTPDGWATKSTPIAEALEEVMVKAVEFKIGGDWEDNYGAEGSADLHMETGVVTIEHGERYLQEEWQTQFLRPGGEE